ncbi:MAG: type II toxin-antitoxin system VapC family toxin [Alphaproteobacteria bacterium]|nr:type II toxin-antitoxin system VapC family toxin [Alphaproteobacteria bacterium]
MGGKTPVNEDRVIVDASVVRAMTEDDALPEALAQAISGKAMNAPDLLLVEVSNAIWKIARFKSQPAAQAIARQTRLLELPIALTPDASLLPAAMALALRLPHSVYDCLYLALAAQLDCAILTADTRLGKAAASEPDLAQRVRVLAV